MTTYPKSIAIHNPNSLPLCDYRELQDFQGDLALPSDHDILIASICDHGIFVPFFVWQDGGARWTLDGHQRIAVLKHLDAQGVTIPPVPYCLIEAEKRLDAKTKLLQINSRYKTWNLDTTFFEEFKDIGGVLATVALPDFDTLFQGTPDSRIIVDLNTDTDTPTHPTQQEPTHHQDVAVYPLAIVLTRENFARWDAYKTRIGKRTDTAAFLTLLSGE